MTSIDVHPVQDSALISDLVCEVWANQYPDAAELIRWPTEFFDWQFLQGPASHSSVCLGGYVNGQCEGVFCADTWAIDRAAADTVRMAFVSCVSVRPVRTRAHVTAALLAALQEWAEEQGAMHFIGYVNPDRSDMVGRRYWTSRPGFDHVFTGGSRQWVLSEAACDALLCEDIVNLEEDDLPVETAAQLVLEAWRRQVADPAAAALHWLPERLEHQLHYPGLAEFTTAREGEHHAVCSFYTLPLAHERASGHIDILALSAPEDEQAQVLARRAVTGAIKVMRESGCVRIFTTGSPFNDDKVLVNLGFVPCMPSFAPLVVGWDKELALAENSRLATFYR